MNTSNPFFRPTLRPTQDAARNRYIHVVGSKVFIDDRMADDQWGCLFLGMHEDTACWGVDVPQGQDPGYGADYDLRSLYGMVSEAEWAMAGRAVQIVEWSRTHRFCGRCGTQTSMAENDRAFVCPNCALLSFPRLAPAIITLVTRGEGDDEQALLARGAQFPVPMFSCLAGFVEAGENLEQAVVREVEEEVGIAIESVSYVASQPWPFPHSIMLGFRARFVSGEINCDPAEIAEAHWYRRDDLPMIPPGISIARRLIDDWVFRRYH